MSQGKRPWDLRWELDKNQNNHKTMISFCSFLLQFVLILQCACEMSPLATSLPFFASPRMNVHSFAFNEQRSFKAKKCKREDWIYAFLCCNKSFLDTFRTFLKTVLKQTNKFNWKVDRWRLCNFFPILVIFSDFLYWFKLFF